MDKEKSEQKYKRCNECSFRISCTFIENCNGCSFEHNCNDRCIMFSKDNQKERLNKILKIEE